MSDPEEKRKKGTFSDTRLSVSRRYIYPASRRDILLLGLLASLAFAGYFVFDTYFLQANSFISSGPLSSNHAELETACSSCHDPFKSVLDTKCIGCHETSSDKTGVYSFGAHYVYRSENKARASSAGSKFADFEAACFSCHPEHLGRESMITNVPDSKCLSCHNYGSFNQNHPEFEFVRGQTPDDANLIFTHINHVMGYIGGEAQKACAACHQSHADGKHFKAIGFDSHCRDCHKDGRKKSSGLRHEELRVQAGTKNLCQQCHQLSGFRVLAVQAEQRVLFRAEFDHSVHVLSTPCLECHIEIPMTKNMKGLPDADRPVTQNIPKISNCQACHANNRTSNQCVTCHEFHPNKQLRFGLNQP